MLPKLTSPVNSFCLFEETIHQQIVLLFLLFFTAFSFSFSPSTNHDYRGTD